jgi:hypothetical protein
MAIDLAFPYKGLPREAWRARTEELIHSHPLKPQELVQVTLTAWKSIFKSSIGNLHIGVDIFPNPQMMGFFIQQLVSHEFTRRYPGIWRGEQNASDKDLVYISNPVFSVEIKTSSDPKHIFGNRSYGQEVAGKAKKGKNGYYLAINFQKFSGNLNPGILLVRFGWLDHTDWLAQKAASGQQARVEAFAESSKLLELYPNYTLSK